MAQLLGCSSYSRYKAWGASLAEQPAAITAFLTHLATQGRPQADADVQVGHGQMLLMCRWAVEVAGGGVVALPGVPLWIWPACPYGSGQHASMDLAFMPIWIWPACSYGSGLHAPMDLACMPLWI